MVDGNLAGLVGVEQDSGDLGAGAALVARGGVRQVFADRLASGGAVHVEIVGENQLGSGAADALGDGLGQGREGCRPVCIGRAPRTGNATCASCECGLYTVGIGEVGGTNRDARREEAPDRLPLRLTTVDRCCPASVRTSMSVSPSWPAPRMA